MDGAQQELERALDPSHQWHDRVRCRLEVGDDDCDELRNEPVERRHRRRGGPRRIERVWNGV